jgi:hypothetical protein
MEPIKIKPQTVIMFVGPTQCGKTYFAETRLLKFLASQERKINKKLNVQYLSSDHIRAELLGITYEGYPEDRAMDFVSEQAFTMLKTKLAAVLSYPVNADFVVLDTSGMSEDFRQEIKAITYAANYNLQLFIFDYKEREDYFANVPTSETTLRKKVADSIKRFRDRMGELSKREYPNQSKIKSNNFQNVEFEIEGFEKYGKYFLPSGDEYVIVGDVHGCYDELKELLIEVGYTFNDDDSVKTIPSSESKVVFIGDLVDKGEQIVETIRFAHRMISDGHAYLVVGNHENFVYNYLKGVKAYTELGEEFISSFIQSVAILEKDEELKQMFFDLVENATEFLATDRFIVTHAPCKVEHLGKVRRESLKAQRNFRFPRRREFATEEEFVANTEKEMAFMKKESRYNHPYHIVGHVMLQHVVNFQNKMMIDTGCVAGGRLTAVIIPPYGHPKYKSVASRRTLTGEIFPLFNTQKFDFDELDPKDLTRIKFLCLEKVNFISGTMAPADKLVENNELESLEQAIRYYKEAGVKKLILQPKFMGSRGNVYLFKDVEKSYITTRNGYLVKPQILEQLKPELVALRDRIFSKVFVNRDVKMILLDAEILPWSLIGGGLINQHFKPVSLAVESETKQLMEHGFETVLNELTSSAEFEQYKQDRKEGKKDELTDKYGHTKERTFRNLYDYQHLSLHEEMFYSDNFKNQLEIHGSEGTAKIEPFAILKVVFEDDTEFLFENESNIDMFDLISENEYAVLDFEKQRHDEYYVTVYAGDVDGGGFHSLKSYYEHETKRKNLEGVVIKPEKVFTPGVAPYIKVRNENYLTIVYGHNYKFKNKYDKLIRKKGVKRKLQTSIKEFELGLKLLRTPYKDINVDNIAYKQLLAQMIIEVEKEKQLDPRL